MVANNAIMKRHLESQSGVPVVTSTVRQLSSQQPVVSPKYIRLPRGGERDPLTGSSRSQLWSWIKSGHVRSLCVKQKGAARGIRLVDCESLIAWIESSAAV